MARDGAGTYNAPEAPVVTATPISSTSYNASLADIATALTGSLARDGQGAMTGNLPMGANRITGMANGSARTDAATVAQLQDGAALWGSTAGGTANVLTIALSPAVTAYAAGLRVQFLVATTNTAAATLNANAVGAQPLRRADASEIPAGALYAGLMVSATWDGTQWRCGPEVGASAALLPGSGAVSAAASVDILLPAYFNSFDFDIFAKYSTDGAYLAVLTSTNGGSSFDTGASDYQSAYSFMSNATTLTTATSALAAFGVMTTGSDNAATSGQFMSGGIFPGDGTRYPVVNTRFGGTLDAGGGGYLGRGDSTALRFGATRINAVRFIPSAGTITGRVAVRGKV